MSPQIGLSPCPPPRLEGTVPLPDGRRLGYAEYGDPNGPLVLWFHGTPGARRQIPLVARDAATRLGLRLVCVERPGVGDSTDHTYNQMRDWAADIDVVADRLGHERFMVAGLSGGGPYSLAVAHELPHRVVAVGLMGPVVPTVGDDELATGLVTWTMRLNGLIPLIRRPLGSALVGVVRVAAPVGHLALVAFSKILPEHDQAVLTDPDIGAMFLDDLVSGTKNQCRAFVNDIYLFGRDWGFRLADVHVPVYWWHGDADPFVPIEEARRASRLLPDVEFVERPGESHLGEFGSADQVLTVLAGVWHEAAPATAPSPAPRPPSAAPSPAPSPAERAPSAAPSPAE